MHLACLVLLACTVLGRNPDGTSRVSCEVEDASCQAISDPELAAFRRACSDEPRCLELSPKIFVLRRSVQARRIPELPETRL